ncbi:MAG: acyl-CoA dehydrogenase family protein, partial [Oscillospiraceae bacterium]|nr:acyl-CoA dehydrogenase family protein [Oscillospiraceae bacterium]
MEFTLSSKHKLLLELYRKFAINEVEPIAAEIDEMEVFPHDTVKKLARYGFLGIPFPQEFGGSGADNLAYAMAVEEFSKHCGTTGVIV